MKIRKLLPYPQTEVNPLDLYTKLPRPTPADRPWVMVNMITSADGATAIHGSSEAFDNPADKIVFSAIRGCADWVLVAAETVRAERYRLPEPRPDVRETRKSLRLSAGLRLAVASSSLNLPLDLPMFTDRQPDGGLPVIFAGSDVFAETLSEFAGSAEVIVSDSRIFEPAEMLAELKRRGARVVLCEGGPSFNAQFVDADLLDELCLSTAPLLVGGVSKRIVHGSQRVVPLPLKLDHLLEAEGTLFARYLTQRG